MTTIGKYSSTVYGIISLLCLLLVFKKTNAQYTFQKGNNILEVSGNITSYYNYRFYEKDETEKNKNRFALDFASLTFDGILNRQWNYQLQVNFADINAPEANEGFLMQATVAYNSLDDALEIDAGYDKIPFSRSSLVPKNDSPFLQRSEMSRGDAFTRRDLGVKLRYSLLNKRLNVIAGVYTGLGSQSLLNENDDGGNLESAVRFEYSYPVRYRYREIDLNTSPLPVFAVAVNGRYADKTTTTGIDYDYLTLDGIKKSYGADFSFMYHGFSFHAEALQMQMTPRDTTLLLGKPTDFFKAGGVSFHANYYFAKIKSVFAVRYDEYNPQDLIKGDTQTTVGIAYNYLINGLNTVVKIHYFKRIRDKDATEVFTDDQVRAGLQLLF